MVVEVPSQRPPEGLRGSERSARSCMWYGEGGGSWGGAAWRAMRRALARHGGAAAGSRAVVPARHGEESSAQ